VISQTAEYALRAAVCLAGAGGARTTRTISENTGVSACYMSKILRRLRRRGIVAAHRGPRGGFLLAKSPAEITALDVIRAVDAPPILDRCPLDLAAHRDRLCPLHTKLARTYALVESAFRESTLRDLVDTDPDRSGCQPPAGRLPVPGAPPDSRRET
jgi:Rrf2 family protein